MEDGSTAEMGMVGNEGVLGVAVFLGGVSACSRAPVLVWHAWRLPARQLQNQFSTVEPLQQILLRYTLALLTQVSQTAVCNRLHSIEQRLCRLLLLCLDRKNHPELHMTQELIANILGGRRESITVAASHLQDAGLIHYSRGRIQILNRSGLESTACECYETVEVEFDRLLGTQRKGAHQQRRRAPTGRLTRLGIWSNSCRARECVCCLDAICMRHPFTDPTASKYPCPLIPARRVPLYTEPSRVAEILSTAHQRDRGKCSAMWSSAPTPCFLQVLTQTFGLRHGGVSN